MPLELSILLLCAAALISFFGVQILRIIKRLAPDKKGLTVKERCTVYGTKTLDAPLITPLASIELVNSVIPTMHFFKENLDLSILKEALNDLLDDAPIFRGRIRFDNEQNLALIHSQNEGIRLTIQHLAGHNIENHKGNYPYTRQRSTYQVPIFIDRLKLEKIFTGTEPLLTVTLTRFENGGTVIGLSLSHLVFDLITTHQFLKMWAERYSTRINNSKDNTKTSNKIYPAANRDDLLKLSGITTSLPAQSELESTLAIPLQNNSIGVLSKAHVIKTTWSFLSRFLFCDDRHLVIHYSAKELSIIKEAAKKECTPQAWAGGNDGLAAHVWQLVTRLQNEVLPAKANSLQSMNNFCLVINSRQRFSPPLAADTIGNILLSVTTHESRENLLQSSNASDFSKLAIKLRSSMNQLTQPYCNALLRWMQLFSPKPIQKMPLSPRGYFTFIPCHESYFMLTNCLSRDWNLYDISFDSNRAQWIQTQGLYGCGMLLFSPDTPDEIDLHLSFPPSITPEKAEKTKRQLIAEYSR